MHSGTTLDIATLFDTHESERFDLHTRRLNEQMVRVLRTIGYDVGFCKGQGADDPINLKTNAVLGEPIRFGVISSDGKVPNWKGTPYAQAAGYGAQSDGISALLKRSGNSWVIVTKAIGCTDVCYVDWWKKYKAPKAIFPYTE